MIQNQFCWPVPAYINLFLGRITTNLALSAKIHWLLFTTLETPHSGFIPELIKELTVPHKRCRMHRISLVLKDHLKQQTVPIQIPRCGMKMSKGASAALDWDLSWSIQVSHKIIQDPGRLLAFSIYVWHLEYSSPLALRHARWALVALSIEK